MFEFLETPCLPKRKVSHVLIAANFYDELREEFEKLGIKAVPAPFSKSLPDPIMFHPDMNCRHLGGNRFAVFKDSENLEPLSALGAELVYADSPLHPSYPYDAALNFLPLGNKLICNTKTADSKLIESFRKKEIIEVKQGYTSCSIAPLDHEIIITGDEGLSKVLTKNGFKVICARSENIVLKGYNNGFIGGASGLISPKTICFTGKAEGIVDLDLIYALGFDIVSLKNRAMEDIGGVVPIMQVSK